jgi:hypothetical protein
MEISSFAFTAGDELTDAVIVSVPLTSDDT